jgi:hypothetical protein
MRAYADIPHPGDVNAHVSCFSLRLKTGVFVTKGFQLSEYSKIFNKLQGIRPGRRAAAKLPRQFAPPVKKGPEFCGSSTLNGHTPSRATNNPRAP